MRSSYSRGWAGASKSNGFGTPSTTFDLPASTAGSGGVTQKRSAASSLRNEKTPGRARRACRSSARAVSSPPNVLPACGADKDSRERPSIDGDSRPGGETMLTPSTDSIDASSPRGVVARRVARDNAPLSGGLRRLGFIHRAERPEAAGRARTRRAASPVGAGACSATAARRTSIATRGAVVLWMPPAAATGYLMQAMPITQRCCKDSLSLSGAYRSKLLHCVRLWPFFAQSSARRSSYSGSRTLAMFSSGFLPKKHGVVSATSYWISGDVCSSGFDHAIDLLPHSGAKPLRCVSSRTNRQRGKRRKTKMTNVIMPPCGHAIARYGRRDGHESNHGGGHSFIAGLGTRTETPGSGPVKQLRPRQQHIRRKNRRHGADV